MTSPDPITDFERDGAALFPEAIDPIAFQNLAASGPGARLRDPSLPALLSPATDIASLLLKAPARPVRAVLFDKTAEQNWALGWHQDRTIAVANRADVPGFGPWTVKQGITHVAPPIEVLMRMATLRIHLDDCIPDNAPLRIALGSHKLGYVAADDASTKAAAHPVFDCLAKAGDVWAYSTPILHASDRAAKPSRRRVLQVDYASFDLPMPLRWLGID
jgi:hypothetical protein